MVVSLINIAPVVADAPVSSNSAVPGTDPDQADLAFSSVPPDFQSVLAGKTAPPAAATAPYVPGTLPAGFAEAPASSKACAKGVGSGNNPAASALKAQLALDPNATLRGPGPAGGTRPGKPATKASPQNPSQPTSGSASASAAVIPPTIVPLDIGAVPNPTPGTLASAGAAAIPPPTVSLATRAVPVAPNPTPGSLAPAGAAAIPVVPSLSPGASPTASVPAPALSGVTPLAVAPAPAPIAATSSTGAAAAVLAPVASGTASTPGGPGLVQGPLPGTAPLSETTPMDVSGQTPAPVPGTIESISVHGASVRPDAMGAQTAAVPAPADGMRSAKSTPATPAALASTVSAVAVAPGAVLGAGRPQTGSGEKFAESETAPENRSMLAGAQPNKHTLDVNPELVTEKTVSIGTSVATPPPVMGSTANSPTAIPAPFTTAAGAAAPADNLPTVALGSASQAVENVLQIGELQAAQSQGTQTSVNLHFTVGGESLSVRVAMQEGQVHTQFTTDSGDLRAALAHEWQSLGTTGTATVRFAEPVFTAGSRGDAKTAMDFAGDSQQQAGRRRDDAASGSGAQTGSRTPGRAPQAPTASPAASPMDNPVVLGRLHSFA